jgi:hypothetical protein
MHFDRLFGLAKAGDWDGVRNYKVTGSNSDSKNGCALPPGFAATLVEGNALLPAFMDDYNACFAKPPASNKDLHRPLRAGDDLDDAFGPGRRNAPCHRH